MKIEKLWTGLEPARSFDRCLEGTDAAITLYFRKTLIRGRGLGGLIPSASPTLFSL